MPHNYENSEFWDGHFDRTIREGQAEMIKQSMAAADARERERKRWYDGEHEDDGQRLSQIASKYGIALQPFNIKFMSVREMKIETGKVFSTAVKVGFVCNSKMDGNLYEANVPLELILYRSKLIPNQPSGSDVRGMSLSVDDLPLVVVRDCLLYMLDEKGHSMIGKHNLGEQYVKVRILFPSRLAMVDPQENL